MSRHESWCCRSPESECAKGGGCSSSCNCDAGAGDECRPVTLPSGETIPVLGSEPMSAEGAAALGELVDVVRAKMAAENPPDVGAPELYERVAAVRERLGLSAYATAKQAGVKLSVLTRLANGRRPGLDDLARIEAWLETYSAGSRPEPTPEAGGSDA